MPISAPAGYLDVTNATLRGSQIVTTGYVGVANANPVNHLSVGSNLHVNDTASNVLQVSGNVSADRFILGGISIEPTFDLESVTNVGNVTPYTVEFRNDTTGFMTTSNVEVGGELTVASNVEVGGELTVASNVEVGTANLFVDTVTGRVGVGTGSPRSVFHVKPPVNTAGTENDLLDFRGDFGINTHGFLGVRATTTHTNAIGHDLTFRGSTYNGTSTPNTSIIMSLKPDGKVGIGKTNPSATLDVNGYVKNTNPVFYARRNSVQNTGVYVFNIQELDSHNAYDPTNGRFTAPIAGRYVFNVYMLTNGNTNGFPEFRKNGSRVFNACPYTDANGSYACIAGTIVLELALNDYVDINVVGGALYGGGNDHNGFCGYMIG